MSAAVALGIAGGLGGAALLASWRTAWRQAAFWFAVAAAGQAAALQMVDAGPSLHYQHYRPLTEVVADLPVPLFVIVLQTMLVGAGIVSRMRDGRLRSVWSARVAIAIVLATCTAATVSPSLMRYVTELALAAYIQILSIATVVLMAMAVPANALGGVSRGLARLLGTDSVDADGGSRPALDRFAWTAAAGATLLAAGLNLMSYQRHPHVPDEVVYIYHARYFAEGRLAMQPPPVQDAFEIDLMQYEPDRWFSPVPPGWPALLSVGVLAGVPWLVNPVLGGVSVLLTYVLIGGLYSTRTARYATALLALSPWFLFLAMSYMTHMFTLACGLVAAVGVMLARETGLARWGVVAGVGAGVGSLIRPLDGLVLFLLVAAWAIGFGGQRLNWRSLAGLAVATGLVGVLVAPYNWALTGDPLRFPISVYTDEHYGPASNAYGFGSDRGLGWAIDPNPGHSPVDGLINANLNTFGLNTDLLGWSTGSLFVVAWLLLGGIRARSDRLMLAVIGTVFGAYFLYYFSGGPDFGPRYWFPMVVPLVALTARGLCAMERAADARVGLTVGALTLMALVSFVPWRAADKYHDFRGMRPDLRGIEAQYGFDGDLVLVRGQRTPDYDSAAILNPVDLMSGATLYAWDRAPEVRAATLRAFPDCRVWLVDGPTVTGSGYRVSGGPFTASELLAELGDR